MPGRVARPCIPRAPICRGPYRCVRGCGHLPCRGQVDYVGRGHSQVIGDMFCFLTLNSDYLEYACTPSGLRPTDTPRQALAALARFRPRAARTVKEAPHVFPQLQCQWFDASSSVAFVYLLAAWREGPSGIRSHDWVITYTYPARRRGGDPTVNSNAVPRCPTLSPRSPPRRCSAVKEARRQTRSGNGGRPSRVRCPARAVCS